MVNRNYNQRGYIPHSIPRANIPHNTGCKKTDGMLNKLQMIDFSLNDLVLYLDAYPHCTKAKAKYNELIKERAALLALLDEAGLPINNMSVTSDGWNWTNGPWPWEYSANL